MLAVLNVVYFLMQFLNPPFNIAFIMDLFWCAKHFVDCVVYGTETYDGLLTLRSPLKIVKWSWKSRIHSLIFKSIKLTWRQTLL